MNQLPTILKKARQALGLTQEDVAKMLGISQRAYAFYEDENNDRIPKPKRLAQLGEVLHIPIKTLMKHYGSGIEENNTIEEAPKQNTPPDLPVLDRLMKQLESRADELKADKERLYTIIESYLNSILSNTQANQEQLKILRTQADIVIKQIAHQDEAILRTQLQKNEIVKGGRDKSEK